MNNVTYQDAFDWLSQETEEYLQVESFLMKLPLEQFVEVSSFKSLDMLTVKWILDRLLAEDKGAKLADLTIPEVCQKRALLHFGQSAYFQRAYELLENAWHILMSTGYAPEHTLKNMVQAYEQKEYKIDQYYRHFLVAYDELNDPLFENLRELVQNIYYSEYLEKQLSAWNQAYAEQYLEAILPMQRNFYQNVVKPYREKVAVIISDAFRYGCGRIGKLI